jgi:hypothetical protein
MEGRREEAGEVFIHGAEHGCPESSFVWLCHIAAESAHDAMRCAITDFEEKLIHGAGGDEKEVEM